MRALAIVAIGLGLVVAVIRCIQSVNYKEGGVAMGEEKQSSGFGFEASEVPELERKEFVTKVRAWLIVKIASVSSFLWDVLVYTLLRPVLIVV